MKTIDVITLPYQSELVEYSVIFDDVTCIQRYYVDLLRLSLRLHFSLSLLTSHSIPPPSLSSISLPRDLTLTLVLSVGLHGQEYVALSTV